MAMTGAGFAQPAPYRVLRSSSLGFTASYEGEPFEGRFTRFTPVIEFDPKQLASARFDVRIDLTSADTSNGERDEVLLGEGFFNTRKSAQARYTSQRFRALGGNRYLADGTLTLNGVSKPVSLNFTWEAGANTVLVGSATLKRLDFAVGTGDWNDIELLPNEVTVKTRLVLATPTSKR
jgi:polyisoprenoid-binding protein YceI